MDREVETQDRSDSLGQLLRSRLLGMWLLVYWGESTLTETAVYNGRMLVGTNE